MMVGLNLVVVLVIFCCTNLFPISMSPVFTCISLPSKPVAKDVSAL